MAAPAAWPQGTPLPQEPQTPVFRADATWVRVDVQAGERSRVLGNLTKEDFVVLDDGVPRKILYFGHV